MWDYDVSAPPNLVELEIGGERVAAVAQITKQGFVFVFDRVTGEPLFPIEERPVPASDVPGERVAATQRFAETRLVLFSERCELGRHFEHGCEHR